MQEGCAIIDEMITDVENSRDQRCTECCRPSGGYTCCQTNHPLCEDCASILDDGYHYCSRHIQDARDEIAEREVYAALAALCNVCETRGQQAYRCKELIGNLGRLSRFYMNQLKPLEQSDDVE